MGGPSAQPVPGSSLELVERTRQKTPDRRTVFHYNFKVMGLPPNETYQVEYWPVGGAQFHPFQMVATHVHINGAGMIFMRSHSRLAEIKINLNTF